MDAQKKKKYELRSQEVQELLGNVPKWIVRWGTFLVSVVLVVLILLANVLNYPDVINSKIILTADVPPAEIKSYTDGPLSKLMVKNYEKVDQGQLLAVIQSAANYNDVIWLSENLPDSFQISSVLINGNFSKKLALGEIQSVYGEYINSLEEYVGFVDLDYYRKKANATRNEIARNQNYIETIKEQKKVLGEEYLLVENKYKRDSVLAAKGVLSKLDLELVEEERLASLYKLKEEESNLSRSQIEMARLKQDLLELELQLIKQNQRLYSELKSKYEQLIGALLQWKKKYLIYAPFSGKVSMSKIWSENQFVHEGDVVLTVLPDNYKRILGRVSLEPIGAGKISESDKVIIRFDSYPYLEYGVVTGKLEAMSLTPESGRYYATVVLDSSYLVTNYNTKLEFSQNMLGTAEIITESRNLFERIIEPLKSAMEIQKVYKN